jgi:acetyl esterase/lipase
MRIRASSILLLLFAQQLVTAAEPLKVLDLWPGTPPGDKAAIGEEHDTTTASNRLVAGRHVTRLGNVSKPTIRVYKPPADKDRGTAVLVCPGGGYSILAIDLEGTEVADWLNSIGITAVLLKYRVPKRNGDDAHLLPLQDAQRAMGLVRQHAREWKVDPAKLGVLGFSAGGHLAASLSTRYEERVYARVDDADTNVCRPDFSILIYPAYLVPKTGDQLTSGVKITAQTPPTFIAMSLDDPLRIENALAYSAALRKASVRFELHIYETGGHGFGLRPVKNAPNTKWPDHAADWLKAEGWLQ